MIDVTTDATADGITVLVGEYRLVTFTHATDKQAVIRFIEQVKGNSTALYLICAQYERMVKWNRDNPGKGKSWFVFNQRERLINAMCKQAGIVDT